MSSRKPRIAIDAATIAFSRALSGAASACRTALFSGVAEQQAYSDLVAARATAVEALEQAKNEAAEVWTNATSNANIAETGGCAANEKSATIAHAGKESEWQLDARLDLLGRQRSSRQRLFLLESRQDIFQPRKGADVAFAGGGFV